MRELEIHNKHNIPIRTLQSRIRTSKLKKILVKNIETIYLVDSIFDAINRTKEILVRTPDGDITGKNITELHKELFSRYPKTVPSNYNTVQSRMIKKSWNNEQAFGFKYPPEFEKVEELIENKDYKWGEIDGEISVPNFNTDYKTTTKPVILHSIKTIYFSEKDWCNAYKLSDRKKVKELFDKGKTPEDVLEHYGKNA